MNGAAWSVVAVFVLTWVCLAALVVSGTWRPGHGPWHRRARRLVGVRVRR